jgi:predicted DCC family thiol-disulfide oxidoreductase YuxK
MTTAVAATAPPAERMPLVVDAIRMESIATWSAPGVARLAPGAPEREDRLVVLYDRDCGLCTATARALRRWDRNDRLELLPLQDAAGSPRSVLADAARHLPLSAALHVVDGATGRTFAGGDAMLAIAGELPGGSVIRPFAAIAPFRAVLGLGYGLVARNRHRIGRWLRLEGPACDVPR